MRFYAAKLPLLLSHGWARSCWWWNLEELKYAKILWHDNKQKRRKEWFCEVILLLSLFILVQSEVQSSEGRVIRLVTVIPYWPRQLLYTLTRRKTDSNSKQHKTLIHCGYQKENANLKKKRAWIMESRSNSEILKKNIEDWFYHLTSTGIAPNEAAARAIQLVKSGKLYSQGFFTCSHFSKGWS